MANPIKKYSYGGVEITVWPNQTNSGKPYFGYTLQKRYKAADGSWKSASSFLTSDLAAIALLAQRIACEEIQPFAPKAAAPDTQDNAGSSMVDDIKSRAADNGAVEKPLPF